MGVIKTLCCLEHFHLQEFFSSWLMKICSCLASPGEGCVAMQSGQSTATGGEPTPCHFQMGYEIHFQQISQKLDLVSFIQGKLGNLSFVLSSAPMLICCPHCRRKVSQQL